jgi:hypothetical protein
VVRRRLELREQAWPARGALIALLLALLDLLGLLVDADRDELDHQVRDAHAPFDFLHQLGRRAELEQHVNAFVVFRHTIRQLAGAPLVGFLDRAFSVGDQLLELADVRVHFFFRRVRLDDEQLLVDSHSSSVFKP